MINAYAVKAPKTPLEPWSYPEEPLGSTDLEIKITHCGICASDIAMIDNDWGMTTYPEVPGHEIIGTVTEAGPGVVGLKKGDRVGIGWQRSSCHHCWTCLNGLENVCPTRQATIVGHFGGFADRIRTDYRYAFIIPAALPSEGAAPLLCGGITVYSPLKIFGVRPAHRVGVIGIGGLGHLAVRFAHAMGCEVVGISHTDSKRADGERLGVNAWLSSTDLKTGANSLDFILVTANAPYDWDQVLGCLRQGGKLCFLASQHGPIAISPMVLIGNVLSLCGSAIGSRATMNEMLEFAARHNIVAQTEAFPMRDVNQAIDRVRTGKIRYRAVLTN